MIDLTTSIRSKIFNIEELISKNFPELKKYSTSSNRSPSNMTSINSRPSQIIRENLLDYTDCLIPRKNLKYDFSLLQKNSLKKEIAKETTGINSIYQPLNNLNSDISDLTNRSFIGIDFGTSSSVCSIAYIEQDYLKVELLEIEQKDHLGFNSSSTIVPSIIGIVNNRFLLGRYAHENRKSLTLGKNGWYGFKENILELENCIYPDSLLKNHAEYKIQNGEDAIVVFFKRIKIEIDKIVLAKKLPLKQRFTFSVPANYGLKEKEVLTKYLEKAEFKRGTFSFIEEPISSLLGTIHQENLTLKLNNDLKIFVIDAGAGTVDFCAIKLHKDSDNVIAENLGIYRNKNIGGNLINKLVAKKLNEKDPTIKIDDDFILKNCEEIKLNFCKSFSTGKEVNYALPHLAISNTNIRCGISSYGQTEYINLTYEEFFEIMQNYYLGSAEFKGLKENLNNAIKNSNTEIDDFDYIIISGGGAKNPYLRNLCSLYFDFSKIILPDNSQEQVAIGNAIQCFVSNGYGKNLIETTLSGNIYIIKNSEQILIFESGNILPTLEYEMSLDENLECIELFSDITNEFIYFEWYEHKNNSKIIFRVTQEANIVGDLVTDNSIIRLTPKITKK